MNRVLTARAAAVLGALALAACTSTGSGGGGGGGGSGGSSNPTAFQSRADEVQGWAPTGDMPTRIKAGYSGEVQLQLNDAAVADNYALGDLDLDVDWTDGQTTNPFSGTAGNFRGKDAGEDFTLSGELTVAEAEARSLTGTISRNASTVALPTGGTRDIAIGAMTVNLAGDLTDADENTETVNLNLGGSFFGDGAKGASGPAAASCISNAQCFASAATSGTFYLKKD